MIYDFPIDMEFIGPDSTAKGIVVRFTSNHRGTVIKTTDKAQYGHAIGRYSDSWVSCYMKCWKPFEQPITIPTNFFDDELFEVK